MEKPLDKSEVKDVIKYAVDYVFDGEFQRTTCRKLK